MQVITTYTASYYTSGRSIFHLVRQTKTFYLNFEINAASKFNTTASILQKFSGVAAASRPPIIGMIAMHADCALLN